MNTRVWVSIGIVAVLLILAVLLLGGRSAVAPVTGSDTATTTEQTGSTGGGFAAFKSGIRGVIMMGPTCPVEKPNDPSCDDKPYATTVEVRRAGLTSVFASVETDAAGAYEFSIPPGEYEVSAVGGKVYPRCAPKTATVLPQGYAEVDITCDSGIR